MCQKAFGNFFAPLVSVAPDDLTWTRGQPKYFQSSSMARRGFCGECGTPLTYQSRPDLVELAIGAFDDPSRLPPVGQGGAEAMHGFTQHLGDLPISPTNARFDGLRSFQHPDHDTKDWPPEPGLPRSGG
jgi:hypothetical protein